MPKTRVLKQVREIARKRHVTQITLLVTNYEGLSDQAVHDKILAALKAAEAPGLSLVATFEHINQPWDPDHDQGTPCARKGCGHPYERHFDSFDDNAAVGCKYCPECPEFVEPLPKTRRRRVVHRATSKGPVYIQKGKQCPR